MKNDFNAFPVGTVFNPLKRKISQVRPKFRGVIIDYPARLNAMAIDPSKIAYNKNLVYTSGEVVFPIKIYKRIIVKILPNEKRFHVSKRSKRKSLIIHTCKIMSKVIRLKDGLYVDVDDPLEIKHIGLGSSSSLIAGVASAINEIYGNPIDKKTLVRYLAQNHGEEIKNEKNMIMPVQCIGGSAAAGIIGGGLLIISGKSVVIKSMKIHHDYKVIIGLPKDFNPLDSKEALEKELNNMEGFIETGRKYGAQVAYNILHKGLPDMENGKLDAMGDIIFNYRYNMGSIKNCSFLYPKLIDITNNLAYLKIKKHCKVLSVSSVGPGIFSITKSPKIVKSSFKKQGLQVIETEVDNNGYKVVRKIIEKKFWNTPSKLFKNRDPDPLVISEIEKFTSGTKSTIRSLDLGCGLGRHSELMARKGMDLYAVDINERMLEKTKESISKFYNKKELKKRIRRSSMVKLPFRDNFFDFIVCTGVLHQAKSIKEYTLAIKELSRVLKYGGSIITNIFSSKIWEDNYIKINQNGCVLTKEGVLMTLLSKEQYLKFMKNCGLSVKGKIVENVKSIETGNRCVLRANFIKNERN